MLTLTARIQQIPPDHRGGHDLATDELTATAVDYDQAKDQVEAPRYLKSSVPPQAFFI